MPILLSITAILPAQRGVWELQTAHHDFRITVDTTIEYNKYTERDECEYSIPRVEIRAKGSNKVIQTIYPPDSEGIDCIHDSSLAVMFKDANFDGYSDLLVRNWPLMYLNTWSFYIYDPDKQRFIRDEVLSETFDPELDPKTKTFHSFSHVGVTTFYHEVNQLINDKWVRIAYEEEDNTMHSMDTSLAISWTSMVLINGKMRDMGEKGSGICHNDTCGLTDYALLLRRQLSGLKK